MATFDLKSFSSALNETNKVQSGVDFTGKSLKLDTEKDAKDIVAAISACPDLYYLTLTGNTLGVAAAEAIAKALESHPELKVARWSDMFTGRMKTEIPPALKALGDGMIAAGARLKVLDLSDNAFGPIGVEGLAKLLQSEVCSELEELRLNNNGLGITGARLLAKALSSRPPKLRVFIAGRNRLENDGATALAQVFEKMGSLEEVAMPQNGIYHVGISALSEAFKQNPQLSCLNLNDNTIGPKGAAAVAQALPRLKNLKAINFGDCLLKSKGARTLAKAFKDNSTLLECLDLSHNEIGRAACKELVDAITVLPDSGERLSRVVLAGNSLGNAASKKGMKAQLGTAGELTDDEGESGDEDDDDDDEGTESEEESDAESEDENTEDSATEDAQHSVNTSVNTTASTNNITLDTSGIEEVKNDVERFLKEPTLENLERLGSNPADVIEAHIESTQDTEELLTQYVNATLSVAGLSLNSDSAGDAAQQLFARTIAAANKRAASWPLTERLLRGLALIKSEEKAPIRWHLPACYASLARALPLQFPAALQSTLRFFIGAKLANLPSELRDSLQQHPALLQD
ncbi:ran GTPase-activating protein 1 isoform X2 [Leguminivora glycinivorella]|uniref:ran GTPase-activating protein 1 isoform X2 n=1 Tax=Leguminivora glycinivorella TaxID=1035111 RepID=UPI00201036DF|nr:ran GTPase-activating protein 1 isoform X2 [Leguminivora glycinivorella]